MPGLLGRNSSAQMLGLLAPNMGATDEAMRRHRERQALLAAQQQPPAPAQRPRVSGWRVFDGIFSSQGDGTISGSLDRERARLRAEAERPQMDARRARIQSYVDTLSPDAQFAAMSNPEELGKAFASRQEGRVLDQGDVYMEGNRPGYAAPFEAAPGSSIFDPRNPSAPVSVARSENKVAGGALVDPNGRVLYRGPQVEGVAATADAYVTPEIAQGVGGGAPRIERQARPDSVTLTPGGEVVQLNPDGTVAGRVASTQQRPISDADQAAIARSESTLAVLGTATGRARSILAQLEGGDLNLGPATNAISGIRNRLGQSNSNSLNYDAMLNWAKEARDAILAANTGVQTDQDAVRALDRVISSPNDERVVRQAIQRFIQANAATEEVLRRDVARRQGQGPDAQGRRLSPQEAAALPPGTRFVGQDGVERVRN